MLILFFCHSEERRITEQTQLMRFSFAELTFHFRRNNRFKPFSLDYFINLFGIKI